MQASDKCTNIMSKAQDALQIFMKLQEDGFRKEVGKEFGVI
jgi:hypothetical protein